MSVSTYSTTPSANTSINGINIDEGCAPGNINNAIRQQMADTRGFWNASVRTTGDFTIGGTLTLNAPLAFDTGVAASTRTALGLGTAAVAADSAFVPSDVLDQATWSAGTSTDERGVSPVKVKTALGVQVPALLSATGAAPLFGVRAWGVLQMDGGGAPAVIAGGNCASVTRPATGRGTVTFTTAMPSANYALVITAQRGAGFPDLNAAAMDGDTLTQTTTGFQFNTYDSGAGLVNARFVFFQVVG